MKFTDSMIKNLKPKDGKYYQREANGFAVCVYPSGVKSWFFIYTMDGKRHSMALGNYPDTSLSKARERYNDAWKLYADGKNPATLKADAEVERRKAPTVAMLVEEYIEKHAKKFKRSWAEDERLLNKEIVPVWGKRKAEDIKKRDVTLLLESIVDRGTPAMSNQVLKIARKMFNFAVERDILQTTPFTSVKALAPNTSRERTLTEVEVMTLWVSLETAAMSEEIKRALKLVLVTAQRPGEVTGMHTSELDGRWWTIPAERAKNGREHRVYLTDTALELIGETVVADEVTGKRTPKGFIFPCPHQAKEQPIDSHALPVAVRRNLSAPVRSEKHKQGLLSNGQAAKENKLGIDQFTPHDLRRSAATFMAGMGVMDEVIDAILNHTKQGIIRTYNRHGYDPEKKQALEAWERKLSSIISGNTGCKIIPISAGRHSTAG